MNLDFSLISYKTNNKSNIEKYHIVNNNNKVIRFKICNVSFRSLQKNKEQKEAQIRKRKFMRKKHNQLLNSNQQILKIQN